jgi:hypothetical protein
VRATHNSLLACRHTGGLIVPACTLPRHAKTTPFDRIAFIPFLCAGDPDLETTAVALQKLDALGADVIELGVPYSVRRSARRCNHGAARRWSGFGTASRHDARLG